MIQEFFIFILGKDLALGVGIILGVAAFIGLIGWMLEYLYNHE